MIIGNNNNNFPDEKTEVIRGMDNIIKTTLTRFSLTKHTIDSCIDKDNPKTIMTHNQIVSAIIYDKSRGIRTRVITEITKDNLSYCKELINLTSEVRHLDDVVGNFSISDRSIYQATAMGDFSRLVLNRPVEKPGPTPVTETIYSTMSAFVAQQQYFFDMLWKKAIPAKQRIKEIEDGIKREFIETIQDSDETLSLISKVISSATEEILIIFSHADIIHQYERYGIIDHLKRKAENDVVVRMLIGMDYLREGQVAESLRRYQHIESHHLLKSIQTKLTTIVADRQLSLIVEEKEDEDDAIGFATYSNSESTVLSYASIFENLWIQSEIKQQ